MSVRSSPSAASEDHATSEARALDCLGRITGELQNPDFLHIQTKLRRSLAVLEEEGPERVALTVYDGWSNELLIAASAGLSATAERRGRYRIGDGVTGRVFRSREAEVIECIADDATFLDRTESRRGVDLTKTGFICVPIVSRTEVFGTLSADVPHPLRERIDEFRSLLEVTASLLSGSVRVYRDHSEEVQSLEREKVRVREQKDPLRPDFIIGNSESMLDVYRLIRQVGPSDATVLIRGESGTGKELVARAIHEASPRRSGPLVSINCAALPEQLVASELFGHVAGAYTGASGTRKGRFELASGGTIFLDEIGEVSATIQVKLLRVLQEGQVDRLGDERSTPVDVRVVAATNADLEVAIREGRFRQDLYYRLAVVPLYLPPLRERKGDITLLADHFLEQYAQTYQRNVRRISTPAIDLLTSYHWPGNVRELENVVARAVLLSDTGVVRAYHLPPTLQTGNSTGTSRSGSLKERMDAYEREILVEALKDAGNNMAGAARLLRTTPRILAYRLKKHGLKK